MRAWLIDADYITENGNAVIRLWCKNDDGWFVIYDRSFKPYFYVLKEEDIRVEDVLAITCSNRKENFCPDRVEELTLKTLGKDVETFKVFARHPQHVPKLREELKSLGRVREADIPFVYRYLIDKGLACMDGISFEVNEDTSGQYEIEAIQRDEREDIPDLKILAFDCEMLTDFGMPDPNEDPIIVIGVQYGDEIDIMNGDGEKELIQRFVDLIKSYDPDMIIGYNQDNFDWPYIKKRAEKYGIRLDIGRDGSNMLIRGGRPYIAGRLDVDLYDVVLRTVDVKVKTLENVAEYLGKKVDLAEIEAKDIHRHWNNGERSKVITYAKQDVIHTFSISEELLPLYYELCKMIRIPLDDATRSGRGKQVDLFLLSEAFRIGEIAPNPKDYGMRYEGAFVIEPERGLHENVVCLDFASMYPSIMIAFNISPDTLGNEDSYVAPEVNHMFKKSPDGFFKRILKMLINKRKKLKEEMKKLEYGTPGYRLLDIKQSTLKVLTNSFYGYTGWNLARWYCRECAEATTAWGRHFIKKSAKIARELGFDVLYGDTDSIFVKKESLSIEKLEIEVFGLIKKLSEELPIQIEVEDYYKTTFFVEKKRYAGLTRSNRLIIKGLEVKRGDWCQLAKKIQREVIEAILSEKNPDKAADLVKNVIKRIKSGEVSLGDYVIYKGLTRRPDAYESVQAHVKAAKKAKRKGYHYPIGSKVGFVVTIGVGNIGDRAFPFDLISDFDGEIITDIDGDKYRIDKDYYIDNQVMPSVLRILEGFGYNEFQLRGVEQKTLDSFW